METTQQATVPAATIGFLGFRAFDQEEAFRGAILVTDEWSKPLEFRCTAPVRPNHLQRTLYGNSLLPHILTELIGGPLVESVREKPEVIIVSQRAYMDVRHRVSVPVIHLARHDDPKVAEAKPDDDECRVRLRSASGKFAPVEAEFHYRFKDDMKACGDRLRDWFGLWDLLEPFKRVSEGLQYVHDECVLES